MEGAVGPPPPPQRRQRWETQNARTITDLSDHTICDILSRLPLKSIFRCRRVCKTWRNLLIEPYFAKLHLSRSPFSLIHYHYPNRTDPAHFGVLELDDHPSLRRRNATMKFRTEIQIPHSSIQIVGSCNGLIWLSDLLDMDTVIVCNPIREQYLILPKPPKPAAHSYCTGYGLGYSPSTDQYKVIRFTETYTLPSGSDGKILTEIYTLGNDDGWRSIGGTGQPCPLDLEHYVYLNGALHWLCEDNSRFICYVDIEKEQFGNFPLPSHIGDISSIQLGVVDNFLYLRDYSSSPAVNIWVMKDYGHGGSFTLEWIIERTSIGLVTPVKILKDRNLLIVLDAKFLATYNPETRAIEKIKDLVDRDWEKSVAVVPSFLSFPWML